MLSGARVRVVIKGGGTGCSDIARGLKRWMGTTKNARARSVAKPRVYTLIPAERFA